VSANSITRLREWFTVDEAAKHLSESTRERVTSASVLRLALDGHLVLSVNLPAPVDVCCEEGSAKRHRRIDGLWDLSMTGAGRVQIESYYHSFRGLPSVPVDGKTGAVVESGGVRCQLPPEPGCAGWTPRASSALPHGAIVVVRQSVLVRFAESLPGGASAIRSAASQLAGGPKLGAWLKGRMNAARLTVNRVHVLCGLDRKTVNKILSGKRVSKTVVQKLAEGLKVQVAEIPTE
jgi:hypothetical protein